MIAVEGRNGGNTSRNPSAWIVTETEGVEDLLLDSLHRLMGARCSGGRTLRDVGIVQRGAVAPGEILVIMLIISHLQMQAQTYT